jgi:hypothetical protein
MAPKLIEAMQNAVCASHRPPFWLSNTSINAVKKVKVKGEREKEFPP